MSAAQPTEDKTAFNLGLLSPAEYQAYRDQLDAFIKRRTDAGIPLQSFNTKVKLLFIVMVREVWAAKPDDFAEALKTVVTTQLDPHYPVPAK